MDMASGRNKNVYIIFTVIAVLCGLIWSFTNVGYDAQYQIAMSYRLLKGDKMFLEMWEPHQTSAFLPAALMWVYMKLLGTTTGIVLYLQICGILIRGAISCLLYRLLRKDLDKPLSYSMALFYFMVSPKDYALPEFGNLQLWYSTLLFCCLLAYLKKGKLYLLILSALWLCLEVLAYPSCAIVLLGGILILLLYSAHKRRDVLIFTGICAGLGAIVIGYFLSAMGPDTFLECIDGMLALEPTHTVSGITKALGYVKELLKIGILLLAIGAIGYPISLLPRLFWKKEARKPSKSVCWMLCCCAILLIGFFLNIVSVDNRSAYSLILLALTAAGFWNRKGLTEKERQIYVCGSVIGGLGFLATLILTDLWLTVSVPYGLLAVIAAMIPLKKRVDAIPHAGAGKGFYCCFLCLMALFAFRCAYIRTPLSGRGQICSSFSGMSIVRTGPAWGLISNEEGVCIQRDSYPEWREIVPPGSKVWIVGSVVDLLGYLYEDVEVAGPSTISTPSYNEALFEYWKLNPDKYPDVVIAEGYLGELSYEFLSNDWMMSWLFDEFRPEYVVDGVYWQYYFRKAP